ncbi:hypothetical protein BKA59DRAFT_249161 [Fusarium tricinctum]|uniref:Uncharacterized protein n=1 Tax=Fusarium tricinctum TaxID=61284 RepID=A0A8K0RQY9_9HYPO|nr:hypothetical protein BKA59DRAFT_249161 [Fusarium tricinctum]
MRTTRSSSLQFYIMMTSTLSSTRGCWARLSLSASLTNKYTGCCVGILYPLTTHRRLHAAMPTVTCTTPYLNRHRKNTYD